MTNIEKEIWLQKHGLTYRYERNGFGGSLPITVQWTSSNGLQLRADGDTDREAWENLFADVVETLYLRIEYMSRKQ